MIDELKAIVDDREWRKSMSDYIKREDAINALHDEPVRYIKAICDVPSADVEPVRHATCKEYEDSYGARCVCSECGCNFNYPRRGKPNYCPDCGARMDGEEQEHERG